MTYGPMPRLGFQGLNWSGDRNGNNADYVHEKH